MNYQFLELITSKTASWPDQLREAVLEALHSGGKKLRPRLLHAAAKDLGTPETVWRPMAAALEVVHTFSLIHDDLPELDNDDWRRGRWTTHRRFGHAEGLLAGDAAFALAFGLCTEMMPWVRSDLATEALQHFIEQSGGAGLIGGQWIEVTAKTTTQQQKKIIDRLKTGALFELAFTMPARIDERAEQRKLIPVLSHAGYLFGEIYQALDDKDDGDPTSGLESNPTAPLLDALAPWTQLYPDSELVRVSVGMLTPKI